MRESSHRWQRQAGHFVQCLRLTRPRRLASPKHETGWPWCQGASSGRGCESSRRSRTGRSITWTNLPANKYSRSPSRQGLVQSLDATVLPLGPQNIWLTSVAASLGGTKFVDDSKLPGVAEFDYVRYFAKTVSPKANEP